MTTYALHFPPYIPVTLKEHYFSDVPAPTAGDDGKALTYRHSLTDYVYTSFEAAGAAASVAAAAATALATHAGVTSGVHGIAAFGAMLNATVDLAAAQTALGLGTAALLNVGVSANNIVQMTAATKLPAVDGSLLTNLPAPSGVLMATGATTGATAQAQALTNGVVTGKVYPPSNSTNAWGLYRANGTTQDIFYDSANGKWGIGAIPSGRLDVTSTGASAATGLQINTDGNPYAIILKRTDLAAGTDVRIWCGGANVLAIDNAQITQSRIANTDSGLNLGNLSTGALATSVVSITSSAGVANYGVTSSGAVTIGSAYDAAYLFNAAGATLNGMNLAASKSTGVIRLFCGGTGSANEIARFTPTGLAIGQASQTALLDIAASTTARASLRIRNGTWATTPNDGDIGNDGTSLLAMLNGTNAVNTDGGLSIWMNSSVPTARNVGRLLWRYTDKTDASRKTEGAVTAFDGATEYKPVRWAANGAAMIGVLGAAPAIRQVVTGSKATGAALVSLLAALATFGWITDSTTA